MIVVANPGTHPEMMRIASGLLTHGAGVRYLTSSNWAADGIVGRLTSSPAISSTTLAAKINRRQLPDSIRNADVVGLARSYELRVQLALKLGLGNPSTKIERRNSIFQQGTIRYIRARKDVAGVVAQYTAAGDIFKHAGSDLVKILNYPIAHHRWLLREMQQEAKTNPKWADLLQGHDFSEKQLENLDQEVDLANKILVPSSFAAKTFLEYGVPRSKLLVTPLGCAPANTVISPNSERRQALSEIFRHEQELKLIYAGQVTQRKGIGYLLEAVDKIDNVHLTIVGSTTPTARALINEHRNVSLIPSQPRAELYKLLSSADLLVLPSLAEGFGLVALEAMANGTPCLLSNATFGPDLIVDGENGYVIDAVSSDTIIARLRSIQKERLALAEIGLAARDTANYYSWTRYETTVAAKVRMVVEGPQTSSI